MTFLAADERPTLLSSPRLAAGTLVSIGLHGLLLAALLLLTPLKALVVPPPQPVAVEIITPQQFAALTTPATPAPPQLTTTAPARPSAAPEAAPPPQRGERLSPSPPLQPELPQPVTHRATTFYSAGILREPGMEHIRRAFESLASSEQLMQLCNIEGIEQIKRAEATYAPDTLVSYAMADPVAAGLTLTATGGAFRSRRKWYGISFKCTVAPDLRGVTAFEFTLGDPIPEDEWEEHNLNAEDADE
jgi:hypothetical protein